MKTFLYTIIVLATSINASALERNTEIGTPSIRELSRGFATLLTTDQLLQNLISGLLSPFIIVCLIIIVVYTVYKIIKYIEFRENQKQLYVQQLIMYKAKEKGLNNYRIKILKGITEILQREEAIRLMEEPLIYEKYIKNFIKYIKVINTGNNTLETICRDIITIYEQIYHGNDNRRPLQVTSELEKNTLLAISSEKGEWFICKLKRAENDSLLLYIINTVAEKEMHFIAGENVNAIFFRGGDAEYRFTSTIISHEGSLLKLNLPDKLERGEPVPFPLTNVNLPCEISKPGTGGEEKIQLTADIFKLNETEAVIRLDTKLKHENGNEITFQISGFTIHTAIKIIGEKHIPQPGTFYYNIKFLNISDAAERVIYSFLESKLFDV